MLSKNEIKYIQSLRQKKLRQEAGQYISEGPKILAELMQEIPGDITCIYATEKWIDEHPSTANITVKKIEAFELEKISALEHPQQVLALVKMAPTHFIPFKNNAWQLVLDGIQDPGNLGSIIRIADWFGISNIYCSTKTADCYNSKVVQAAMGSLWRVNICYGPLDEWLAQTDLPVYGALLDGQDILSTGQQLAKGIIVIGSEGKGIGDDLLPYIKTPITIPKIGKAESLNAAVATGIILAATSPPPPLP